jgi:hypothetical protein
MKKFLVFKVKNMKSLSTNLSQSLWASKPMLAGRKSLTRIDQLLLTCTQKIKGTKTGEGLFIVSNQLFIFVFISISLCYSRVDTKRTNRNEKKIKE